MNLEEVNRGGAQPPISSVRSTLSTRLLQVACLGTAEIFGISMTPGGPGTSERTDRWWFRTEKGADEMDGLVWSILVWMGCSGRLCHGSLKEHNMYFQQWKRIEINYLIIIYIELSFLFMWSSRISPFMRYFFWFEDSQMVP